MVRYQPYGRAIPESSHRYVTCDSADPYGRAVLFRTHIRSYITRRRDPWWTSLDLLGTQRMQHGSGEWIWTFRGSFKDTDLDLSRKFQGQDCSVTSMEWTSFLTRLTGGGVRRCNDERAETRIVNKLVDSLTTFQRFSAPRTLLKLQELLIK